MSCCRRRAPIVESLESRRFFAGDPVGGYALPMVLDFNRSRPGLLDRDGTGIGFHWAQPNRNANEYQPSLVDVKVGAGVLRLYTTGSAGAGSNYEADNTLVNALTTTFAASSKPWVISARLNGPPTQIDQAYEQGGILFGPDQDNYVKLVVAADGSKVGLQFLDEQAFASGYRHALPDTIYNIGALGEINTIDLYLAGDPTTGYIRALYRINGGTVGELPNMLILKGDKRSAFFSAAARAGVMAQHKNDGTGIDVTFDQFAIQRGVLSASGQTIVQDGQSPYVIVLAQKPLPANQRAANELNSHLKQIAGVTLPIQNDAVPLPSHAILIGPNGYLDDLGITLDSNRLGNDGFILRSVGDRLVVAGPGPRGSMYGVSEVLEKLGVRWFTSKVTSIPRSGNVRLPALSETQVPDFEYRDPFFVEAWDKDWAARNRVVGYLSRLDSSTGGTIRYSLFVHTLDTLIPPELYTQHPEYFPLKDGKRIGSPAQRCLSNPEVLALAIAAVKKSFRDYPDATICSISQNDGGWWCACDQCNSIVNAHGGVQSALYVWFANKVAEAIAKDYPDKLIDTLAYDFTEAPPTGIVPRDNVRIRLCAAGLCRSHAYDDPNHPDGLAFIANLAAWSRITDNLYVWDYNTNFTHYLSPFADFGQFPDRTRLYLRNHVKGVFFEGDYSPGGGGSDAELRSWVMAQLLWDVDADADALVTEWMKGVYGPAWQPMRQWFDLVQSRFAQPETHLRIRDFPSTERFTSVVMEQGNAWFNEALALAQTDLQREYIEKARLSLRYIELVQSPRNDAVFDEFLLDIKAAGIQHIGEWQTVDQWKQSYLAELG